MADSIQSVSLLILLIGGLIATTVVLKTFLDRTYIPALVGFMMVGVLLRLADDQWNFLSEKGDFAFEVLAELGIIVLLFRVGLESNLMGLIKQLRRASVIWLGNVMLSAALGYGVVFYVLEFGQIPSLIAAIALTATSIGVSLEAWRQHDALSTRDGQVLTDVAEMDDLSGVALMALLFAIVPLLRETGVDHGAGSESGGLTSQILSIGGLLFLKFIVFAGLCVIFARYGEQRLTSAFKGFADPSQLMIFVAAIGIFVAGVAGLLGFSVAVGALFAGFAFSRDPEAVHIDAGFEGLYHLFAPFFFIGIGVAIDTNVLTSALGVGIALIAVAIIGKTLGAGLPALLSTSLSGATMIGVSLVPRAEITMIIMEQGRQLGDWAIPPDLYAGFVFVSIATCLIAPVSLQIMFKHWRKPAK